MGINENSPVNENTSPGVGRIGDLHSKFTQIYNMNYKVYYYPVFKILCLYRMYIMSLNAVFFNYYGVISTK